MNPPIIIEAVATVFNITPEQLTGPDRRRQYSEARICAMALLRLYTRLSHADVADLFGGRLHHASMYSVKKFTALREIDRKYNALADQVTARLGTQQAA